ncbi:hypothetical protein RSOLAG1IB_08678 [Rhizoctonia solani AG-1 IB]|uniref:Uncharacterized protein n=1 Tax=Thanatephorus cucumeris (strain AG1-IB / isolate 7/3/14) TaxID=1108050 RepID=A0A0B7FR34_THACB|nr:hypothetical protein RSOLAG1IB_08678 [Rhizoctonia solani AG-1 IB]
MLPVAKIKTESSKAAQRLIGAEQITIVYVKLIPLLTATRGAPDNGLVIIPKGQGCWFIGCAITLEAFEGLFSRS